MSIQDDMFDEPILDYGARYRVGEPTADDIENHRSDHTLVAGLSIKDGVATLSTSNVQSGGTAPCSTVHRHRRRRKRLTAGYNSKDECTKPAVAATPSEHVMFLLGECDGEEEQPHQLFCELDELWNDPFGSGETEWREAARWIKFEEDVEENGERWSKPHVATLLLYSIFELRNCLTNAIIMLNLDAYTMEHITDLVLNLLVSEGRIPIELREQLCDILLRRHVHLHERSRPKLIGRSATHLPIIRSLADIGKRHSSKDVDKAAELPTTQMSKNPTFANVDTLDPATAAHIAAHAQANASGHSEVMSGSLQGKYDLHFLKKIAPGSETSNILVGETSFLTSQITVFIRLKESALLGDLTEVPVPTRFLFIHLGKSGGAAKYREIGRSMGVLMSDEVFHDVAYKARSRADLLAGLDEFLSVATVLPPGEWDPSIRIEPPASVPSQDSRKTNTTNGGRDPTPTTDDHHYSSGQQPNISVMDQLHAGGDKLAGLCLAAVSNVGVANKYQLQQSHDSRNQSHHKQQANSLADLKSHSKSDLRRSHGSHLELNSIEAGGDDHHGGGGGGGGGGGHGEDPTLQRTGRMFGGLIQDLKRRSRFYASDFTDACHVQCCASLLFLYFACLTPIITFGGLLAQATGGYLGTMESILSGVVVGVSYALFSGQPLTIMGSTGPVLVFETIIYKWCTQMAWSYLSFRLWIGIWVTLFLLIIVMFDLSALVKYITRFTEESFALLIALIFMIEALKKTFAISQKYKVDLSWSPEKISKHNCRCIPPEHTTDVEIISIMNDTQPLVHVPLVDTSNSTSNKERLIDWNFISHERYSWKSLTYEKLCTQLNGTWEGTSCEKFYVPDVFFFSCLLFICTFILAVRLKAMRNSPFFPNRVRALIADFSVVIAIVITTTLDYFMNLNTPKLRVPEKFEPTLGYTKRSWMVFPFDGNPWWTSLVAFVPALLAVILIFMDQQITAVIVNRSEHKLVKGAGYHLDLLIVSFTILINSFLGIPWFVAATVLSINHVLSLKKESETNAPGERPVYLGCREQRVTGCLIFSFIGLSIFATPLLCHIPMPVLYGIFLFMGYSSLDGMQMFQRVGLLFMPVKYQPDYPYLRHVALRRVHLFTVIQVACLVILWIIKSVDVVSILFPVMVLAMCFIRKALDFVFTPDELKWLDQLLPNSEKCSKHHSTAVPPRTPFKTTSSKDMGSSSNCNLLHSESKTYLPPERTFNITEEVSKTSIWRQLSGTDMQSECVNKKSRSKSKSSLSRSGNKSHGSKSRGSSNLDRGSNSPSSPPVPASTTTVDPCQHLAQQDDCSDREVEGPEKPPVLFCIDPQEDLPKVDDENYSPMNNNNNKASSTTSAVSQGTDRPQIDPLLSTPLITINPPSNQGSPETNKREM